MNLNERILADLSDLEAIAQLRQLETVQGVDLSSNDYLGLARDPRMKLAVLESVNTGSRISSTGSRLLSGHAEVWDELESDFAEWAGAEAALYFTSGYAANIGLLSAILRPEDLVFSDSANHASLIDGLRLAKCRRVIFPHRDLNALEEGLRRNPFCGGTRVIVTESVFSMNGDRAPLSDLAALAGRYGAELIVDEAHATGVFGPGGSGCVAEAGLTQRALATVHTCGKALAAAGAFVCGSEQLRQFLINHARTFIFSTGLPPYFAAQVASGMSLAKDAERERAHLLRISSILRSELHDRGFEIGGSDSQIVPVILGSNGSALNFAEHLKASGFGVRAMRPPTVPSGSSRIRLSLTANLTDEVLAQLVAALTEARRKSSLAQAASASS